MDVNCFLIDEMKSLIEAMEQLNQIAKKVLFVTRDSKFVAAVTDGDIRRWILKQGSLETCVKEIANYSPHYITEERRQFGYECMKVNNIEALPIVDKNGDISSVMLWNDDETCSFKELDVPVVIMAGGLGKRLYPYTKILPKPLIPIGEIPIVEHIINRFRRYNVKDFTLIVNHKKNMIKAYFNEVNKDYTIYYAEEERRLGTAGGLYLLKDYINTTFILTNCDILIEEDYTKIISHHRDSGNVITMVCSLKSIKIPYGVVEINNNGEVERIKEKPESTHFVNTGMYVVEPNIIQELEENRAIDFPTLIESYVNGGARVGVYPISESNWLDMGQLDGMEDMKNRIERTSEGRNA